MLITFKSKAAADVLMYEQHAKHILDLLHKDVKRGVISADELDTALSVLEPMLISAKNREANEPAPHHVGGASGSKAADADDPNSPNYVSFATRVYPLLAMLREAKKQNVWVAWGI